MAIAPIVAAPTPRSLEELEDQLYGHLVQRIGEIQASWTRWTVLAAGTFILSSRKIWAWWFEPVDPRPFCQWDADWEDLEEVSMDPIYNQTCPNSEFYCPWVNAPVPWLENINLINLIWFFSGFATGISVREPRFLNGKKAITHYVDSSELSMNVYRTLVTIDTNHPTILAQTPPQGEFYPLQEELRKRRKFLFTPLLQNLSRIWPHLPDFDSKMKNLMGTALQSSALEQLRDIQRCRSIIGKNKLVPVLEDLRIPKVVAQIIVGYYLVRPFSEERCEFEFNHPLFW